MARSLDIVNLCGQPESARDEEWERAFLASIIDSKIELDSKEPNTGPDGWPYMFARTSNMASEPAVRLLDWLLTRGIGLVINAHKEMPDYIFTYGMIWGFKQYGSFNVELPEGAKSGMVTFEKGSHVVAGPPTEDYLPIFVREILHEFLKNQGVTEPKILVLSQDKSHYDLCVSLESLGNPPDEEHEGIAEAISWFLPNHYSLLLASEQGLPKFFSLK